MEIQRWWQRHFAQNPGRQITVDQIETCKQLALNGIGYAILPSITLTGDEDVNKIPLLNSEEEFELTRDTWLIGYESSFELKQVDAFRPNSTNTCREITKRLQHEELWNFKPSRSY